MFTFTSGFALTLPERQLTELFQYRYKVFIENLGWELATQNNIETDAFDHEQTCYVIARNNSGKITGCSRLLPTTQPYLLESVFPDLLSGKQAPKSHHIWELSRFTSMNLDGSETNPSGQMLGELTQDLLWESFAVAKQHGATGIVSVSPVGIERLLKSMGVRPVKLGKPMVINGYKLFACYVDFRSITKLSAKVSH